MCRQSKLPLEDDTGAANRSNRNDIAHADWADYKCAVLILQSFINHAEKDHTANIAVCCVAFSFACFSDIRIPGSAGEGKKALASRIERSEKRSATLLLLDTQYQSLSLVCKLFVNTLQTHFISQFFITLTVIYKGM